MIGFPHARVSTESLSQIIELQEKRLQRRILIVDDEAFNQIGLINLIKSLGRFKGIKRLIDTANDGEHCIKKAEEGLRTGHIYNLIFMDLSMPGMDGFDATEALR